MAVGIRTRFLIGIGAMADRSHPPAADLFAGIDDFITVQFGLTAHYRTETANRGLLASGNQFDGVNFVAGLFAMLQRNWAPALSILSAGTGSRKNFRWHEPQTNLAAHNPSREVTLEREFIRACQKAGRLDWSNQVPVVSGIAGSRADKRRAIDLVHRPADGSFEFIELKVDSDTPLYAALEVVRYGLLWLLSREAKTALGYSANVILNAPALRLTTLAPLTFYASRTPPWLAAELNRGILTLGRRHGVDMTFCPMAFPQDFHWPAPATERLLMRWFDDRQMVEPCD
jgi:hypothetical protein